MGQPMFEPTRMQILTAPHPTHRLDSRDVDLGPAGVYRLFTALPKAEAAAGWPSLWLLDGNAAFDRLPPDLLARHPGLAVVGLGYPTDMPFDTTRRALDYTPPPLRPDPKRPERMVGGAGDFLPRLTGPLRDAVESGGHFDPNRRMLAGHSYGGLCAIHAMSGDSGFARFAAISPALWLAEDLTPPPGLPLSVIVGDRERERGAVADPEKPHHCVPAQAESFVIRAGAQGRDVRLHILPGADHGATLAEAQPLLMAQAQQ